ncbi:MAG: antitoxin family protein [Chloroflexota bacterium]|nr:antitoxin family protein [Chloroflexota bacterium]
MVTTITAVYDEGVFRPDTPLDLEPNGRYRLTIEPVEGETSLGVADAWDVLASLAGTVQAPSDWSSEHNHYLYGTPKRRD